MAGGIKAWEGTKAVGPKEMNMDLITGEESPSEIIAIGYRMEESLGRFYQSACKKTTDAKLVELLTKLAEIEEKHKTALMAMSPEPVNLEELESTTLKNIMEGGFNSDSLLQENKSFLDSTQDVLSLAMMLETQSMDLYLRFSHKSADQNTKKILFKIATEEKAHLATLGKFYDRNL